MHTGQEKRFWFEEKSDLICCIVTQNQAIGKSNSYSWSDQGCNDKKDHCCV